MTDRLNFLLGGELMSTTSTYRVILAVAFVIGLIGFGGANAASTPEVSGTYSGTVISYQFRDLSAHPLFCVATSPVPCTPTNNVNIGQRHPDGTTFTLVLSSNLPTTGGEGLTVGHMDSGATMTLNLTGTILTGTLTTTNVTVQLTGVLVHTNFFLIIGLLTQTGQSGTGFYSGSGSFFTKAVTGSTTVVNFTASGVDVDGTVNAVSASFSKP